jgi:peptidoglycan hydrolase-like protein with peptidoglycan-binding domain
MRRRHIALPALLVAAAAAGAVADVAIRGGGIAPAPAALPRLATSQVIRTNLATTALTGGTLGYAPMPPLVNQLAGTYTWLPAAGSAIAAGQELYRVNNLPVILMTGELPAWRSFSLGMAAGPDIAQLQAGLIAEGYASGLLSAPTGRFDQLTADAVARWQAARGYQVTGQIALGQIVFLPSAVLVGAQAAAVGDAAAPGQPPYQVSTQQRIVTVPLNPDLPPVQVGEPVSIVLPTNAVTPGVVVAITPIPSSDASGSATEQLIVNPREPGATGSATDEPVQVSLSIQSVQDVLAVPVTALLALNTGRYGVEVITGSGAHRIVGVTTGIFAGGRVQVSGRGISAGERVVVSQ